MRMIDILIYTVLEGNAHSVFLINYHLILAVKYRHKVFDDCISAEVIKNHNESQGEHR